jgi:tryptophan-rich sensory protein
MRSKEWLAFGACILLCEGAGVLGSFFSTPAIASGWYATLVKPELAPPNWVFGPVWTLLYFFMATAAFLVWRAESHRREVKCALFVFALQLALTILWSALFFALHSPAIAFAEIIVLWLAIIATIGIFVKTSRMAALLLLPYLLWVSFAAYLNYSIWMLNS